MACSKPEARHTTSSASRRVSSTRPCARISNHFVVAVMSSGSLIMKGIATARRLPISWGVRPAVKRVCVPKQMCCRSPANVPECMPIVCRYF